MPPAAPAPHEGSMGKTVKVEGYERKATHRKGGKVRQHSRKGADVKATKVAGYTRKKPSKKAKTGQLL